MRVYSSLGFCRKLELELGIVGLIYFLGLSCFFFRFLEFGKVLWFLVVIKKKRKRGGENEFYLFIYILGRG